MEDETETWMEIVAETTVETNFVVSEPVDAENDPAENFEELDPPAPSPPPAANAKKEVDGQIEPPGPQNRALSIDPEFMDCIIDWMLIGVIIFCLSVIFKT